MPRRDAGITWPAASALTPTPVADEPGSLAANPFTATARVVLVVAVKNAALADELVVRLDGQPGVDAVYPLTAIPETALACSMVIITDAPGLKPFNAAKAVSAPENAVSETKAFSGTKSAFSQPVIAVGQTNAHAMTAFEHGACGFIQLPLQAEQIQATIAHMVGLVHAQARQRRIGQAIIRLSQQMRIVPDQIHRGLSSRKPPQAKSHRITLRSENAWCTIECGAIQWVQAAGDYMCIYTADENYVVRITLNELCKKLCPHYFTKVNRSVLVNRRFVKTVQHAKNQAMYAILKDDTRLRISRKYFTAHWQQAIGQAPD